MEPKKIDLANFESSRKGRALTDGPVMKRRLDGL